jgi:hypothetical protein
MFQSVFTRLRALGARAASDLAAAHLRTQAVRIIRIASVAFAAQIATTGLDNAGWKVLAAVAVSAVEAGVRQVWPTLPLSAVLNAFNGLKETKSSTTPSAAVSSPVTASPVISSPAASIPASTATSAVPPTTK